MADRLAPAARIIDTVRFMVRPTYLDRPHAAGRASAAALVVLFAFGLALTMLTGWLINAWDAQAGFLPSKVVRDRSLAQDAIEYLILAPVLEELVFRGWLTGRAAALRFAAYGFAAMGLLGASLLLSAVYAQALAWGGVGAAFVGLFHWSLTRSRDTAVPAWFKRQFHVIVWASSMAFGAIHLGNYAPLTSPLGLLAVMPQTIGGMLLAYTRTRLGLGAAMAYHAAYNAVFMIWGYSGC